ALVQERAKREHPTAALRAVVADVAVAELPQEVGLGDRRDAHTLQAGAQVRRGHRAVLDARRQTRRAGPEGLLHRVEAQLDRAVANAVHRELEAGLVGGGVQLVQLLLADAEQPGEIRLRVVRAASCGRWTAAAAVDHHLEGPEAEPVVAEAGPQLGLEEGPALLAASPGDDRQRHAQALSPGQAAGQPGL